MRKTSWVVLAVLGVAITLLSLVSAIHAYNPGDDYGIGGSRLSTVGAGNEGVVTALRGIRGTSAAFATAYGVLFLAIVLGPYRRGEVWAWTALLVAGLVEFVIVLLRVPILGTQLGVSAAVTPFAILVVGLLLDVSRLRSAGDRRTRR